MSIGYGWEGIRYVRRCLVRAMHVPERLCDGSVYLGRYNKCSTFIYNKHTNTDMKTKIQILVVKATPRKKVIHVRLRCT